jgi:general secretion pathway protein K
MNTPQKLAPPSPHSPADARSGSALVVVLWILLITSLMVGSFAFEMQLEAKILTLQRKQFKAEQLALAGIELAKSMFLFDAQTEEEQPVNGEPVVYEDPLKNQAARIKEGVPVDYSQPLGDGTVRLIIDYEKGRRCLKTMTRDDWLELFDQAGIPNSQWDELIDCLDDWQDESEEHRLNGAESDDPFYVRRGYRCKNAPVDTVEELLLIKGWTPEILYGTPPDAETDEPRAGLAQHLTAWGDGKINPNSASRAVLESLVPHLSEEDIDAILEARLGPDGEPGTADDGIRAEDFGELGLDGRFGIEPDYVNVIAIGEVGDVQSRISCIFKLGGTVAVPLFWLEGNQENNRPGY